MRGVGRLGLVCMTKAEKLFSDNMVGIMGSKHNRCSKYCSCHLFNRSKSRLMEGKEKLLFEVGV